VHVHVRGTYSIRWQQALMAERMSTSGRAVVGYAGA
jgi:hypothetical protein